MQNVRTKSAFTPLINTYLKLKLKEKNITKIIMKKLKEKFNFQLINNEPTA